MGIFDHFRSAPTVENPTPEQQQTLANPTVPSPSNSPMQLDPTTGQPLATSPLDQYADLWKTTPVDPNAAPKPQPLSANPQAFVDAAKQVDFSQVVTPEIMAAIAGGGEGAAKALMTAMNATSQAVYAQTSLATTKITEEAIAQARREVSASMPGLLKRDAVANLMNESRPELAHPAIAPIVDALQAQIIAKYPTANAREVQSMVDGYLKQYASVVSPAPMPEAPKTREIDWSAILSAE